MHWTEEKKQDVRRLYQTYKNVQLVSQNSGVPETTVKRWCRDLVDAELVLAEERYAEKLLLIAEMRRQSAASGTFDIAYWTKTLQLAPDTIRKAVRGNTFKIVNTLAAPFLKVIKKEEQEKKARELYQQGLSYNEIKAILNVSKASLSRWCKDLVKKKIADPTYQPKPVKRGLKNGPQVLSEEQVLEMRRDIRLQGKKAWRVYAEKYHASISVVGMASRGVTFKHLNPIEPPYVSLYPEKVRQPTRAWKKIRPDETLIVEMNALRRSDPIVWTYSSLAKWISEKTGRRYKPNHVAAVLLNRDPSLKELELIDAIKDPKPLTPRKSKKITDPFILEEKRIQMNVLRKEKRAKEAASLREMIRQENLRDAALAKTSSS